MEAPSGNSLLVACDDQATLEAALSFLDNCDVEPLTGPSDPSQARDMEPTSIADISDFLEGVDIPQVSSGISDDNAPVRPINAVPAPSHEKRRRTTRKQEIAQLRAQERELACKLELLRLQAYGQKQRGGHGKNGNVLPFWKKIASRQYQNRRDSEMENRRLRSLVAMHVGRAKRLKIAWKKQMATEGYQHESEPIVNEIFMPFDTPAVLEKLAREADGVYAALEAFTAGVRPQRRDLIPFLEHSDAYTLPFDQASVGSAMWHALAMRFKAHEQRADSSDSTIRCCVLRRVQIANMNFSLRIRWVGRKYCEKSRTVIITQTCLEPQLPAAANIGFRETQVSMVAANDTLLEGRADSATSTINTYTSVTCNGPEGGSEDGLRSWIASPQGASVRNFWMNIFEVRKSNAEDQLFEETRVR